ncbi:ABC transporter substrate-binding protein [Limobrevibacterium gyesilva]|uniref:ABC transporter substrate-binding protein n=1 Tax=Limobrevibacterium gyesilva TaxID=2991712 RepID=A0AA41YNX9_9PROT|nr:ABC transporter substrate-binding protein [Limobrevibacterium gyesilva]MCW3473978.1 ABC transporter substrate-binding protein [Limobrevibacterium gyesilva]
MSDSKSVAPAFAAGLPASEHDLARRSLLRLALAGVAVGASPLAFAQSGGATPRRGGRLTIGADADPIGLDPNTLAAFSSYDFTSLMYSGLLRWNADMKVEPDLATGYEQPDDTTYVFRLRSGVTFHNGQAFDAEDVKYTFDRILNPATASPSATIFSSIKSVTVIDPATVRFELKAPNAAFLSYMATNPLGVIVPRGVGELNTKPVGTGPFVFESYQPNQQFTLKANPDYYEKGQPYLDSVVFRFFKDQASLTSALRSKAIDMTWFKDPKVSAQIVRTSPDLVSAPGKTTRTFPVWMNMKAKPLDDVRVRRALSLATDRQACLQTVLGGSGKVAAMIPESHVGGYDGAGEMPYYKTDVAAAKKLLAEAGYPNGIDLGDYNVVAANPLDVSCAQILQQQWAEAGIKVAIKPMETAPLLAMWVKGEYPTLLSVALSWSPDPDAIVSRMTSTNQYGKSMGMADAQLDAMIAEARTLLDPAKRAAGYMQIQRRITDQAYVLDIYQYPLRWEAWWSYAKGYVPLAANIRSFVRTTWIDK